MDFVSMGFEPYEIDTCLRTHFPTREDGEPVEPADEMRLAYWLARDLLEALAAGLESYVASHNGNWAEGVERFRRDLHLVDRLVVEFQLDVEQLRDR